MDCKLVFRDPENVPPLDSMGSFASVENSRCPDHFDLPIQYFCVTCKRHCFCSECALTSHQNCEVLTLKDAFNYVLNNEINKWISQLSTKSENLQVGFRQYLGDKREMWALKLQDLQNNSNRARHVVFNNLTKVNNDVKKWVLDRDENVQARYKAYKEEVEKILREYENASKGLREQRKNGGGELLRFYNQNFQHLRELLLTGSFDHEKDLEFFVKHTPKELRNEISAIEAKFKEVVGVINNYQYNVRT